MKVLFITVLISLSCLAGSISKWQQSFDKIGDSEKKKISFGLVSTVKFGVKIGNYEKDTDVNDLLEINQEIVNVGSRYLKIDVAHKVYNPNYPTVIGHFGFSGDVDEGNAKYFAINFHKTFPKYNLLLIQTMASANFSFLNCHYNLGGIDEAKTIVDIAQKFVEENKLLNELYLIGGSSSSVALFHSSVYLNKHTNNKVKGMFLQSGFNNMTDIIDVLESSKENFKSRAKRNLRPLKAKDHLLSRALLSKRIKAYKYSKECKNYLYFGIDFNFTGISGKFGVEHKRIEIIAPTLQSYYDLVRNTYSFKRQSLIETYNMFYPSRVFSPESLRDYYEKISLPNHIDELNFPFFWLHAQDDPMSDYKLVLRGQEVLKTNQNFASLMLKNGGHSAFKEVQGEEFLNSVLRNFFNGTNKYFDEK